MRHMSINDCLSSYALFFASIPSNTAGNFLRFEFAEEEHAGSNFCRAAEQSRQIAVKSTQTLSQCVSPKSPSTVCKQGHGRHTEMDLRKACMPG
eukprot:m.280412 g.280412  ORF g.280412 m.280412 type:complete len:94 (+) comp15749_c0_seq1:304-585(+)